MYKQGIAQEPSTPHDKSGRCCATCIGKLPTPRSEIPPELTQPPTPAWIFFEPLPRVFEGGAILGHREACLLHAIDVVGVTVEAPSEFFDGEELCVIMF